MLLRNNSVTNYVSPATFDNFGMSHSVTIGDAIYFSGLAPLNDSNGQISLKGEGSLAEQLEYMLSVLDRSLITEKLDRSNLAAWTIYTLDSSAFMNVLPTLAAWVGVHRPAFTLVEVKGFLFPGQLLEITAIAAR